MSHWIYRHHLIAGSAEFGVFNDAAREVEPGCPGDTLSVPLSADGSAPATAWGASGVTTEPLRVSMLAKMGQKGMSTVRYWRCDAQTGVLQATNVVASQGKVGQVFRWDNALADAGLVVVTPDGGGL